MRTSPSERHNGLDDLCAHSPECSGLEQKHHHKARQFLEPMFWGDLGMRLWLTANDPFKRRCFYLSAVSAQRGACTLSGQRLKRRSHCGRLHVFSYLHSVGQIHQFDLHVRSMGLIRLPNIVHIVSTWCTWPAQYEIFSKHPENQYFQRYLASIKFRVEQWFPCCVYIGPNLLRSCRERAPKCTMLDMIGPTCS